MKVGIIGASGFIGLRAVEFLEERMDAHIIPIVRSYASLAVLARVRRPWRVCDLLDTRSLVGALEGCDVVVHVALGDSRQIVAMARVAYKACAAAHVKRLVWMSSASVHGQSPVSGTKESSPLHVKHPFPYNNAKVLAERELRTLSRTGSVEIVLLRPSIVYGPRSRWITEPAEALRQSRAGWVDGGRGMCNCIYVDNLCEAIRLACIASAAAGEAFLVNDAETVTWKTFLLAIAAHLGYGLDDFEEVAPIVPTHESSNLVGTLASSSLYGLFGSLIPWNVKRGIKAIGKAYKGIAPGDNPWAMVGRPGPRMTEEMNLLQQCEWKLPNAHIETSIGYRPVVSFEEGMKRSLEWFDFIDLGRIRVPSESNPCQRRSYGTS